MHVRQMGNLNCPLCNWLSVFAFLSMLPCNELVILTGYVIIIVMIIITIVNGRCYPSKHNKSSQFVIPTKHSFLLEAVQQRGGGGTLQAGQKTPCGRKSLLQRFSFPIKCEFPFLFFCFLFFPVNAHRRSARSESWRCAGTGTGPEEAAGARPRRINGEYKQNRELAEEPRMTQGAAYSSGCRECRFSCRGGDRQTQCVTL